MWHDILVIEVPVLEKILRTVLVYATIVLLFRLTGRGACGGADTPARLGPHRVYAAFFALAPEERTRDLHAALLARLDESEDIVAGVSALPFGAGLIARVLGPSSIPVRHALHTAWDTARRHLTGSPAPDLRKG